MGSQSASTTMHTHSLPLLLCLVTLALLCQTTMARPQYDDKIVTIKISREDQGIKSGFDSAVSKQDQSLVVNGPPAPLIDFSGSATYQQPAFPHVPPFLAFNKNNYHN